MPGLLIAIAITAVVLLWWAGDTVLRIAGLLTLLAGLVGLGLGIHGALIAPISGAVLWLIGHWLYAVRHHTYRSPLARRVFLQLLSARLDPTRRWVVPMRTPARHDGDSATRTRPHRLSLRARRATTWTCRRTPPPPTRTTL